MSSTALELEQLRIEKERFELEELKTRVNKQRLHDAEIAAERARQEADEKLNRALKEQAQAICTHRKGGQDLGGLVNGNDSNYATVTNTYPLGNKEVLCLRCEKVWAEPSIELRKENPKLYRELMREFTAALNFTTDNRPSGRQIFRIERAA